jgi:hypothetical protein
MVPLAHIGRESHMRLYFLVVTLTACIDIRPTYIVMVRSTSMVFNSSSAPTIAHRMNIAMTAQGVMDHSGTEAI